MLGKIAVSLLFLLLVWGNIVAGLKVGLACPDWPLCHGKVLPPFRSYTGVARLTPILTVLLLLFQIILGGVVVLLKLPVDLTTFHFSIALIIFSLTFYMAFFNGMEKKPVFSIADYSGLFFLIALLVFTQAVLGAYVRHSEAGLACPDFPKCLGYWVPPGLSGIVLTHFSHRSLAYIIFFAAVLLYGLSFINSELNYKRSKILILILLIILQIIVGVSVIHSKLYFLTTAFHLAIAISILSIVLYIWFQGMVEKRV